MRQGTDGARWGDVQQGDELPQVFGFDDDHALVVGDAHTGAVKVNGVHEGQPVDLKPARDQGTELGVKDNGTTISRFEKCDLIKK